MPSRCTRGVPGSAAAPPQPIPTTPPSHLHMRLVWCVSRLQRRASASLATTRPVAGAGPAATAAARLCLRAQSQQQHVQGCKRLIAQHVMQPLARLQRNANPGPLAARLTAVQRLQQLEGLGAGGGAHVQHAVVRLHSGGQRGRESSSQPSCRQNGQVPSWLMCHTSWHSCTCSTFAAHALLAPLPSPPRPGRGGAPWTPPPAA